jgi:murein DD-endopeptidase MepM/ murein hydrolase activator NlpD
MRTTRMLGVTLLFLVWTVLYPVSRANAYFAEDSFALFRDQAATAGLPQSQPAASGVAHRVAQGETIWSLSRRYNVSIARLIAVNKVSDPTRLKVGRVLIIPDAGAPAEQKAQTVQKVQTAQPAAKPAQSTAQKAQASESRLQARAVNVINAWDNNLNWPLTGRMTQQFGPQTDGTYHHGLDIAGSTGMPVRAAQRGVVVNSGWLPVYGFTLIIDHGSGFRTLYAHLHDLAVKNGAVVEKDQVVAHVGSSGNTTGPHLHFEVRRNNQAINPLPYLSN